MDKMELLQDLSVDFSQLVKKHIKGLKKLSSKDQKAFGKLFGDFKDGLDDMSTNESVNEAKYNYKQDAMDAYMKGKITAKELDQIAKKDFKSSVATKKELQGFLDSGYMKQLMANTYGLKVPAMEKKVKELMRFAESVTLKEEVKSLTELSSTQEKMIYFAMGVFRLPGMNRILYKWVTDPKARKGSIKLSDEDIKMMFDEFNIKLPKNAFKEDLNNDSVSEMQMINKKTGKDVTRHVLDLLQGKISKKEFEKLTGLKK